VGGGRRWGRRWSRRRGWGRRWGGHILYILYILSHNKTNSNKKISIKLGDEYHGLSILYIIFVFQRKVQ